MTPSGVHVAFLRMIRALFGVSKVLVRVCRGVCFQIIPLSLLITTAFLIAGMLLDGRMTLWDRAMKAGTVVSQPLAQVTVKGLGPIIDMINRPLKLDQLDPQIRRELVFQERTRLQARGLAPKDGSIQVMSISEDAKSAFLDDAMFVMQRVYTCWLIGLIGAMTQFARTRSILGWFMLWGGLSALPLVTGYVFFWDGVPWVGIVFLLPLSILLSVVCSYRYSDSLDDALHVQKEMGAAGKRVSVLTFDRFRVARRIRVARSGPVYQAVDESSDAAVLLYVATSVAEADKATWLTNARVLASFEYPGVLSVVAHGEEDGVPFLAVTCPENLVTLDQVLSQRGIALPAEEVFRIGNDIAGVISAAARRGMICHELRPDLVLCGEGGTWLLPDLFMDKAEDAWTDRCFSLDPSQYPYYLAPEQVLAWENPAAQPSWHAAQFSLGLVLYRALTGIIPYESWTLGGSMRMRLDVLLPHPGDVGVDVTEPHVAVLQTLLARSASERYPSPGDLERAFEQLQSGQMPAIVTSPRATCLAPEVKTLRGAGAADDLRRLSHGVRVSPLPLLCLLMICFGSVGLAGVRWLTRPDVVVEKLVDDDLPSWALDVSEGAVDPAVNTVFQVELVFQQSRSSSKARDAALAMVSSKVLSGPQYQPYRLLLTDVAKGYEAELPSLTSPADAAKLQITGGLGMQVGVMQRMVLVFDKGRRAPVYARLANILLKGRFEAEALRYAGYAYADVKHDETKAYLIDAVRVFCEANTQVGNYDRAISCGMDAFDVFKGVLASAKDDSAKSVQKRALAETAFLIARAIEGKGAHPDQAFTWYKTSLEYHATHQYAKAAEKRIDALENTGNAKPWQQKEDSVFKQLLLAQKAGSNEERVDAYGRVVDFWGETPKVIGDEETWAEYMQFCALAHVKRAQTVLLLVREAKTEEEQERLRAIAHDELKLVLKDYYPVAPDECAEALVTLGKSLYAQGPERYKAAIKTYQQIRVNFADKKNLEAIATFQIDRMCKSDSELAAWYEAEMKNGAQDAFALSEGRLAKVTAVPAGKTYHKLITLSAYQDIADNDLQEKKKALKPKMSSAERKRRFNELMNTSRVK